MKINFTNIKKIFNYYGTKVKREPNTKHLIQFVSEMLGISLSIAHNGNICAIAVKENENNNKLEDFEYITIFNTNNDNIKLEKQNDNKLNKMLQELSSDEVVKKIYDQKLIYEILGKYIKTPRKFSFLH